MLNNTELKTVAVGNFPLDHKNIAWNVSAGAGVVVRALDLIIYQKRSV